MDFKRRQVTFDLHDVGSEIIDQLSSDIYTQPEAIVREIVKNAYDSYLGLDPDDFDDEAIERQILITRSRDAKGMGRLFITDRGIGQDLTTLKRNAQISISTKPDELDNANGFRGLGSWAVLGAGSRVIITSRKKGHPTICRLTFNVRSICGKLGPGTTLHDILNDQRCMFFSESRASQDYEPHGTIVEIECDGPREAIGKYEINRLHAYTDPEESDMRELLLRACAVPFAQSSPHFRDIARVYKDSGYKVTALLLDGKALERKLPDALTAFHRQDLRLGGKLAAIAWTALDPQTNGSLAGTVDDSCNLAGPSIQLTKLNVPVGKKGLYANQDQSRQLNWYVGEIHLVASDIRPDAGGQDLRAGTARDAFVEELRRFYERLNRDARGKSERINLAKDFKAGINAAKRLEESRSGFKTVVVQ